MTLTSGEAKSATQQVSVVHPEPDEEEGPDQSQAVGIVEDYVEESAQQPARLPLATGLFFWILATYFGLISAGSSLPDWLTTSLIGPSSTGLAAGSSVAAIIIVFVAELTALLWFFHKQHEKALVDLNERLESLAKKPTPDSTLRKNGGEDFTNWITFLEARDSSLSSWVQAMAALGALVPAATLIQTVPPFHASLATALLAGFIAGLVAGFAVWSIQRTLRRREGITLVESMVLGGILRVDRYILKAYLTVVSR